MTSEHNHDDDVTQETVMQELHEVEALLANFRTRVTEYGLRIARQARETADANDPETPNILADIIIILIISVSCAIILCVSVICYPTLAR